jgi:two-component system CheB/CheR fusion protein
MRPIDLPDLSGLTLIVAEDTDDSLDVLTTFLKACGARVMAARNGLEALAHLDATPRVDAIVTDLAMPQMDGVELVRKLRGHARGRSLPAIALTGYSEQYMDTTSAGFDAVLIKPVDLDRLCGTIKAVVSTSPDSDG